MRRTQAGSSLLELLMSLLMTMVVAGALFSIFVNTYSMHDVVVGQGATEARSRTPIDLMADHLRNAQQYFVGGNEALVTNYKVVSAANATSVTYYRSNSSTDTVRYFLDGTLLRRTAGGTTTVAMSGINSLELIYFKAPTTQGLYNNASVVSTTDPHQPTAAELPYLSQIQIKANVVQDGFTRELQTLVRLRNSPRKVRL
jgi:Tfp pilus assembly protein PilW